MEKSRWYATHATTAVIKASPSSFQRPFRPSERLCVTLMKSSRKPMAPQPTAQKQTVSAGVE